MVSLLAVAAAEHVIDGPSFSILRRRDMDLSCALSISESTVNWTKLWFDTFEGILYTQRPSHARGWPQTATAVKCQMSGYDPDGPSGLADGFGAICYFVLKRNQQGSALRNDSSAACLRLRFSPLQHGAVETIGRRRVEVVAATFDDVPRREEILEHCFCRWKHNVLSGLE
jgi:hypothetical protein